MTATATTSQADFTVLKTHLQKVIVGQEDLLDRMMIAMLTGGHLLLEGPPGLAKTTAVKTLADAVKASFQRIQFTPDLMPGDVMGSDILDPNTGQLTFVKGPVFNEILLADEINRAPPKVQSALLEAMAEKQVTAGGLTRELPELFIVMATQNPLEQSGTYPLPEAQLDRFMLHVVLDYPDEVEELEILRRDRAHHFGEDKEKLSAFLTPEKSWRAPSNCRTICLRSGGKIHGGAGRRHTSFGAMGRGHGRGIGNRRFAARDLIVVARCQRQSLVGTARFCDAGRCHCLVAGCITPPYSSQFCRSRAAVDRRRCYRAHYRIGAGPGCNGSAAGLRGRLCFVGCNRPLPTGFPA